MIDLDVAYKFRKKCEKSDSILQRFLANPPEDALTDEYDEVIDPLCMPRSSKDGKVVLSSDAGIEYRLPSGINVKRVKGETGSRSAGTASKKGTEHTIYLKSEPLDDDTLDENECIDVMYDIDSNYEEYTDTDKTSDSIRKVSVRSHSDVSMSNDGNSKVMQIKPVRTNKVRLGHTSANKGRISGMTTLTKTKMTNENASKENTLTNRSMKTKTNAKGEPKQPKTCEICGNTYMYQHALER